MRQRTSSLRRLAVTLLVAVGAFAALSASAAQAAPTPQQLYKALLKAPKASTLPSALSGATTKAQTLSAGSKKHHAVGAVEIGNTAAIVGFLIFPTHALALADLKAFPPNVGPNKVLTRTPADLPRPAYILRANGNGYVAVYAVFVLDNVIVDAWTYGQKGSDSQIRSIVQKNALWAKSYGLGLMHG
ncbi:MAG TPA: hypothetical protein VII51_08370 [Gaiellaceae bacterium]